MEDRTYVLGTHDAEIERLGLQHAVWRPRVLDAWQRAGITRGMRVVDAGCGPGHASLDLAEIVGPSGTVHAIDRSRRFLDDVATRASARGITQIATAEADLALDPPPALEADAAWCRWVLCFTPQPQRAIDWIAGTLRPGGRAVFHEYFDYGAWRSAPRSAPIEDFVAEVMASWRREGGEPDIARDMLPMLEAAGLRVSEVRPLVSAVRPRDFIWQWPAGFIRANSALLEARGAMTADARAALIAALDRLEADPDAFMITPGVLEMIATKV